MTDGSAGTVDRWTAVLAGPRTWTAPRADGSVVRRSLAGLHVLSCAFAGSSVLVYALTRRRVADSPLERLAPVVFAAAVVAMLLRAAREACGGFSPATSLTGNLVKRTVLGVAVVGSVYALAPGWPALVSWPLGIAMGADIFLTTSLIGWELSPFGWWAVFLRSPLHVGILGGLIGAAISRSSGAALQLVLPVYVTTQVWVLLGCVTMWWLGRLSERDRARVAEISEAVSSRERRRSAHWLHDDLCAQLRLVILRVQTGRPSLDDIAALLDDLDFQLRLRQLDEVLDSGSARLGELLQPYVRRAQNHGVIIRSVPTYEVASLVVDTETGRAFARAVAILTSNALNAGATSVAFEIQTDDGALTLYVEDDAGGFDLESVPVGRGLWSLRDDLGVDNLAVDPLPSGSRARATIRSRDHGSLAAR